MIILESEGDSHPPHQEERARMGLPLEVRMDFNRRTVSKTHSSLSRQGSRWVSATVYWQTSSLTIRLEFDGVWELHADGKDGTNIVRGKLGSNELTHSFEPKEKSQAALALSA